MPDVRILIISNYEEPTRAYVRALSGLTSEHGVASSYGEAQSMAIEKAYNGMLLDLVTLVRCSKEDKLIAYGLINLYPTIRIKYDNKTKEVILAPVEQSAPMDSKTSLRLFIENRCKPFTARPLSRHERTNIWLDVLLFSTEPFSHEESIKTFTVNVSQGGAFLHTTQSFQRGDWVWVQFKDLTDSSPIKARVCWKIEWGCGSRSISGIGIEFEILSEGQKEELFAYCKKNKLNPVSSPSIARV